VDEAGPVNIFGVGNFSRIQDVNVELLFTPPDADFWRIIGNPRPHVGATVNFGGLESMAYAGLTWRLPVFDTGIFIEGGLGGAVTNGALSGAVYPARNLGCVLQFHEQVSVGYQVTDNFSAMLTYEHASHANLCGAVNNRGLSNFGARIGWTF
jgi:lipid A 3-O-deacylase